MADGLVLPRPTPRKLTTQRVDNDLVLKRLHSGEWRIERREADVLALLQQCLAAQARVAAGRQVLLAGVLPTRSVTLSVDALGFCRIVGNLLSNAIKLAPPGSRVEVTLREVARGVALSVRDEGPGLNPEDVPAAFAHPRAGEPATGRGLQIVKRLAAAHGAQICVISAPGRGATFTVVFPALRAPGRLAAAHPRPGEADSGDGQAALEGGG
jgi:signal transduction histidine kinase